MNKEEYESFLQKEKEHREIIINHEFLRNKTDRTLLYGYTLDRDTWHVYIKNLEIHTVIYGYQQTPKEVVIKSNQDFVPDKRLYPETCDYEFCAILKRIGIENLPFTAFNDLREPKQYYGKILE
jgi:hypothetical protein